MGYVAIQTKFLGPTNHRGARIKATAMDSYSDGKKQSITVNYDYGTPVTTQHKQIAEQLLPLLHIVPEMVELVEGGWERGHIYIPVLKDEYNFGIK